MNDRVRESYDKVAEAYAAQRDQFKNDVYLERFASLLTPKAKVLDLGCGSGLPVARFLLERGFEVRGIDISPKQVELARLNVPGARFEVGDMQALTSKQYHVGGIVALYSIFHIDRREHGRLLVTLRSFLPKRGALLLTMGASAWEGSDPDFFGAEMSWSHYGPSRNRAIVEAAGFTVLIDEIDRSGGEKHQVMLVQA